MSCSLGVRRWQKLVFYLRHWAILEVDIKRLARLDTILTSASNFKLSVRVRSVMVHKGFRWLHFSDFSFVEKA